MIGGADKVAFLAGSEIWIADLDGSDLLQLTSDGAAKSGPAWSLDGQSVYFISENCARQVSLLSRKITPLACFPPGVALSTFEISPDEKRVAISLDQELFIVPFEPQRLAQAVSRDDLLALADCPAFAPYHHRGARIAVRQARWSRDGQRLAIVRKALVDDQLADLVHILDLGACREDPPRLDEFPGGRFEMDGYADRPELQNISWDGEALFALFSAKRNGGFGDLWVYDSRLHKGYAIAPIENACCYRDPVFSPDGRYLFFAFQDRRVGASSAIRLYYLPTGTIGTGLLYAPFPLPEGFFADPRSQPQPALRPAH